MPIYTGDILDLRALPYALSMESLAMTFGGIAFLTYCITGYLYRDNVISLLDCITILFWIAANYVWMVGEFFLRFQSLNLDDRTEGDDRVTRIISSILFIIGIFIQFYVICWLSYNKMVRVCYGPGTGTGAATSEGGPMPGINPINRFQTYRTIPRKSSATLIASPGGKMG